MLNSVLHTITNRANDFASPMFNDRIDFIPAPLLPAAYEVLQLLRLDYKDNDFYIAGALGAIYAHPELLENFGAEHRTYSISDYQRAVDSMVGFSPIADVNGPFSIQRQALEFPVAFALPVYYVSDIAAGVQVGNDTFTVPCTRQGLSLFPAWPAALGISGGLLLESDWAPGFSGLINHEPVRFPYDAIAALLDNSSAKNDLLLRTDLIEHYHKSRAAIEKVGTVLLALGYLHPYHEHR